MIRFNCPSCGMAVSAPEECAGRSTRCRSCGNPITVPQQVQPKTAKPPVKPPEHHDKSAPGRIISPSPIKAMPPETANLPLGPRNNPSLKPKKPVKSIAIARSVSVAPRKRSLGAKRSMLVGCLALVFAAGGLFGFGVYRYLDLRKDEGSGKGNDTFAQAPVQAANDRPLSPSAPVPTKEAKNH